MEENVSKKRAKDREKIAEALLAFAGTQSLDNILAVLPSVALELITRSWDSTDALHWFEDKLKQAKKVAKQSPLWT